MAWTPSFLKSGKGKDSSQRSVEVGWLFDKDKTSIIWDDPVQFRRNEPKPNTTKSVVFCPAAVDFDARHFVINCPVDLHLAISLDDNGQPHLKNAAGDKSTIRNKHLNQMLAVVSRNEWRHPRRPIVQVITPYLFVSDEPVYINQLPPFLDYADPPWPGLLIAGRFPIHIWPRPLMWAFEWYDLSKELIVRRGQPWCYARFEADSPTRPVRVVEAELTPEGERFVEAVGGVTNYVNRTFSLFDRARRRRPEKLYRRKGQSPS